jgi:hypothetical protein
LGGDFSEQHFPYPQSFRQDYSVESMLRSTDRTDRPPRSTSKGTRTISPGLRQRTSLPSPSNTAPVDSAVEVMQLRDSMSSPTRTKLKLHSTSSANGLHRHSPGKLKYGRNGNVIRFLDESAGSTIIDDSQHDGSSQEGISLEVSPASSDASIRQKIEQSRGLSNSIKNMIGNSDPILVGNKDTSRPGLTSSPSSPALATENDSKWHDCIKASDWENLEKMIKKYDAKYYKKKQKEAKEQMELELRLRQEVEEGKAAANVDGDDGGNGGKGDNDEDSAINNKSNETPQGSRRRFSLLSFASIRSASPGTPNRDSPSSRPSKYLLPKALSGKFQPVDPSEVISPLLTVDDMGRTPLHLACIHKAPETMLLDLLTAERKAAQIKDKMGQLALHCALQSWQHDHVLEKIIKSYPNALKTKDNQRRTPVGLAVQLARQRQEEEGPVEDENFPFLWSHPTSETEKHWQFQQVKVWSKVNFLLRDLMKRKKSVIPSEHDLILEALEGGANPKTINRLVSTADRYLMADDELAGTAVGLCIERHYSIDTLGYLLVHCRERSTIVTDSIQKALRTHYRQGCTTRGEGTTPFGKQVIDWAKDRKTQFDSGNKNSRNKTNVTKDLVKNKVSSDRIRSVHFVVHGDEDDDEYRHDSDDQDDSSEENNNLKNRNAAEHDKNHLLAGMDKACKDWWDTLNFLVFFSAYGRQYKETVKPLTYHLLHAALAIPVVPPSLIQLLLIVYPEARTEMCPLCKALPMHIACTRWKYDVVRSNNDLSLDRVLKLMLKQDPELVYRRHKGRLPIHMALSVGQSWTFIKQFVSVDKKSVGMRDPHTKFFPFQMAALPMSSKNIQLLMRNQFTPTDWRTMSFSEKQEEFIMVEIDQERKHIGTIYELLRRYPDAINGRPLYRSEPAIPRSLRMASKVSRHYLSFVYGRNGNGIFKIRSDHVKLLRDAIVRAEIPPDLDTWWEQMQDIIWNEAGTDIPKTPPYLLHAALCNPGTPPLVVELLLVLYPSAATKPIPGTNTYPLHIAAGTMAYQRQSFEMPYGMDNLHLVLLANKRALREVSNGRLPLHICLARGKTWKEVRPLVKADMSTLMVEDGQSGLLPFQLLASFKLTSRDNALRYSALVEKQTSKLDFHLLSARDKALALSLIRKKQELNQLTCLFELLRHRPSAMTTGAGYGSYAPSGGGSAVSSAAVSITSHDDDFLPMDGIIGTLGQLLQTSYIEGEEKVLESTFPSPKKTMDLPPLLGDYGSDTLSPPTPRDGSYRPSLSVYLTDGADKTIVSTTSRNSSGVYSDYVPPTYDDDAVSNIGESTHSGRISVGVSPGELSNSSRRIRRGKRPIMPIDPPDLDM